MKLNHTAFIELNDGIIKEFYTDNIFDLWNGFRLLAIDGKKSSQRIKLDVGIEGNFTYYGPSFKKIENIILCQGEKSLRKNLCRKVDRRAYSSDETLKEAYLKESNEFRNNNPEELFLNEISKENLGFGYDTNEDGLIVTYFDVAYEGVNEDKLTYLVGDKYYHNVKDLFDAIKHSQAEFTKLDIVRVSGLLGRELKSILVRK
jgi:hypothetical protein